VQLPLGENQMAGSYEIKLKIPQDPIDARGIASARS
jgi:hypothetical protein